MLNEMMNNVIRKYGFEHKATIWFCGLVETCANIAYIKTCYEKLMRQGLTKPHSYDNIIM